MYGENKQNKTPEYVRKRGRAEKGLRNRHCRPFQECPVFLEKLRAPGKEGGKTRDASFYGSVKIVCSDFRQTGTEKPKASTS